MKTTSTPQGCGAAWLRWTGSLIVILPVQLVASVWIGAGWLNLGMIGQSPALILASLVSIPTLILGFVGPWQSYQALRKLDEEEAGRWLRRSLAADLVLLAASAPIIVLTITRPVEF